MAFLNKKEDVIDIQLTQYGKYLISQGSFKPHYYAFFDDDIIYDLKYTSGSVIETQNDIEGRILDSTPSMSTQYLFHGVDDIDIQNQLKSVLAGQGEKIQQKPERHFALSEPLSNSELASQNAPSFNIRLDKGTITGSTAILTGSGKNDYEVKNIPQLNLRDVVFYSFVGDMENDRPGDRPEIMFSFQDGTYINVEPDHISLTVMEDNVPLSKENFDIEVYVLDQNGHIESPLYFQKKKEVMRDGILLDPENRNVFPDEEGPDDSKYPDKYPLERNNVEYFFNVRADGEVVSDPSILRDEEG
jgi:hypothetical protein